MKTSSSFPVRPGITTREALAMTALLAAGQAIAATPAPASDKKEEAQPTEPQTLSEMVVDAVKSLYKPEKLQSPKFTAPIVNTPQSITVVPKEVYTQQAAQSLNDVLKNTPGITFLAGEGGAPTNGDNQFRMRGFDASNSIFVDGVRDSGQQTRDIYNIEQVEIARGPAGADIGRSTAAGYINLATKAPQLEEFLRGTTALAFDETDADANFRQTLDYNLPLAQLPLPGSAMRLNALWQEGGVVGRELAESNRWALAPSFATGLGTDSRVILQFEYLEQNNLPDHGLPYTAQHGVTNDTSYGSKYSFEDVRGGGVSLRFEKDFNENLTFTNQTRFNNTDRKVFAVAVNEDNPPDPDPINVPRNFTANDRENEVLSNISNLRSKFNTGPLEHLLSTTFELTHEGNDTVGYANGTPGSVTLHNPSHSLPVIKPTRNGASTESDVDTVALSLFDTITINKQWQVTGGARLEYYDLDYTSIAADTNVPPNARTSVGNDDLLVNGKVGIVFKPVPIGSIYASYGYSEQNPGTNLNMSATETGTGADNVNIDPQESVNYEIGTKWELFDKKLLATLAAFRTEQTNIALATDINNNVLATGEQTVTGVEASVGGEIVKNWAVFGGLGYAKSDNKNSTNAAADGAQLQWTPEWSANLWSTYRFDSGLTLGGGVRYSDSAARQTTNTPATTGVLTETDEYIVVDAVASYDVTKNVTLRLNVNNVFNDEYISTVNNNGKRFTYGAPRSYVLSADWKF